MATAKATEAPTIDNVRTAVLHLVELAAAFEGRGAPLDPEHVRYVGGFGRMSWIDAAAYRDAGTAT